MSNEIRTITDLEAAAIRHSRTCWDEMADMGAMAYDGGRQLSWKPIQFIDDKGEVEQPEDDEHFGFLEDHGYAQLVERMQGPPPSWLLDRGKCPEDLEKDVLDRLIQYRAMVDRKNLRLRMRKPDGIRAVLSDQYTVFDNHEFVEMVGDAIEKLGQHTEVDPLPRVKRASVGDYMRVYITLDGYEYNLPDPTEGRDRDGGGLHPSIYLKNSELGDGGVWVYGGLWRQVCTNGLMVGHTTSVKSATHRFYTKAAFRAAIADMVAEGVLMSKVVAEKFVASYNIAVEPNRLTRLINEWAASGVTVASRESWETMARNNAREYGFADEIRLMNIVNGATQAAQLANDEEETEAMEKAAGKMLMALTPGTGVEVSES